MAYTQIELDYVAFYGRVLANNPDVAKYINNMVEYISAVDCDDYDRGVFHGTFDALRSAGIVTLHDKTVTRRYIEARLKGE